jgi:hypothetical protein
VLVLSIAVLVLVLVLDSSSVLSNQPGLFEYEYEYRLTPEYDITLCPLGAFLKPTVPQVVADC